MSGIVKNRMGCQEMAGGGSGDVRVSHHGSGGGAH